LRIPDDIAVAGFDAVPRAAPGTAPLTTVRQPAYEIGKTAALRLLQRLQEGGPLAVAGDHAGVPRTGARRVAPALRLEPMKPVSSDVTIVTIRGAITLIDDQSKEGGQAWRT